MNHHHLFGIDAAEISNNKDFIEIIKTRIKYQKDYFNIQLPFGR